MSGASTATPNASDGATLARAAMPMTGSSPASWT
jgi:hypothetical protein